MQLEITLRGERAPDGGWAVSGRDLGFLLHKNPGRPHLRDLASGQSVVFFRECAEARATAVLAVEVDAVALVRGKSDQDAGLLGQYVNDRAFAASSFLSVAIAKTYGQTVSGVSKERQALADRALDFSFRVTPLGVAGEPELIGRLFTPLGYAIDARRIAPKLDPGEKPYFDLRLDGTVRLADALSQLYVLIAVIDGAKHWYIDRGEVERLLAKGEGWLARHPERELIAKRALKNKPSLIAAAIKRLQEQEAETAPEDEEEEREAVERAEAAEQRLEKPMRLHEIRLDAVADALVALRARRVLDLGCGEGRLIDKLLKIRGIEKICGVDGSTAALERAARKLRLGQSEARDERVALLQGGLTYADRRLSGYDAAALVEVIEHIDPWRLTSAEDAVFGAAAPGAVIVTTPNREYNALFDGMAPGAMRHADHRFEWTRDEFAAWAARVATAYGYAARLSPLGPEDATHGAPSQMAIFERSAA